MLIAVYSNKYRRFPYLHVKRLYLAFFLSNITNTINMVLVMYIAYIVIISIFNASVKPFNIV